MSAPVYCECGNKIYVSGLRRHKKSRGHDLCAACWKSLHTQAWAHAKQVWARRMSA